MLRTVKSTIRMKQFSTTFILNTGKKKALTSYEIKFLNSKKYFNLSKTKLSIVLKSAFNQKPNSISNKLISLFCQQNLLMFSFVKGNQL